LLFLFLSGVVLIVVLLWRRPHPPTLRPATVPGQDVRVDVASTNGRPATESPQTEAQKHRQRLEQNGEVPIDADKTDWELAQQTSWWGKPLDPAKFWQDKPIWLDAESLAAARRRGRGYPPIPIHDPRFDRYENERDFTNSLAWDVEGPNIHFRFTERESVFWSTFNGTHPHPPDQLESEQNQLTDDIWRSRFLYEHGGNPARTNPTELREGEEALKAHWAGQGCPPEALTDDALFWAHVMKKRQEYESALAQGMSPDSPDAKRFSERTGIDSKYISDPLTSDQAKAASAWKITYLRRLRSERADEHYIQSYLRAWNLAEYEVFGQ
jgi:hypothetical protein